MQRTADMYAGIDCSGRQMTTGPMFNGAHPTEGKPADFKGSMMVLRGATEAEIREIISGDIYTKSDVWDLEKMQIIPVSKIPTFFPFLFSFRGCPCGYPSVLRRTLTIRRLR